MGLFVSIIRYTPEQAEALEKRWDTILKGTAPKAVMDAWAKIKVVTMVVSPQNGFNLSVLEVTDQTWIDGTVVTRYMQDVCSLESYPACSMEQWMEVTKRLPLEQIPKKK
jgi:hypothetical protein